MAAISSYEFPAVGWTSNFGGMSGFSMSESVDELNEPPIRRDYIRVMARYNSQQNEALIRCCGDLTDAQRKTDCGAFFRSIHETFSHLIWADRIWLYRLGALPPPKISGLSASTHWSDDWAELVAAREGTDRELIEWADTVSDELLSRDVEWYSEAAERTIIRSVPLILMHLFNHQAHHRGQIHAMVTRLGGLGYVTDLAILDLES